MIKVENEETTAAIFKYAMTEKGTITDDGNYVFSGYSSSQFTDLNIEGRMFFNSDGETCISTNVIRCNDTSAGEPAGHLAHSGCWAAFTNNPFGGSIYNSTETSCIAGSGIGMGGTGGTGGGDAGGPSSNSTDGVGASGGTPDPVVVTPIPCRTGNCMELDIKTPCKELEDFYKIPQVIEYNNNMIDKLDEVDENGFQATVLMFQSTGNTEHFFHEALPEYCSPHKIIFPRSPVRYGIDHTHTIAGESYQIFSFDDVYSLYTLRNDFNVPNFSYPEYQYDDSLFFVSLTVNGFKYSIKIDDFNLLKNKLQSLSKRQRDKLDDKLEGILLKLGNPDTTFPDQLSREFVKFVKGYGISLYRKSTDFDDDWVKLILNSNETDIEEEPC